MEQYTRDHGGIIRGPQDEKRIALIFTGGDFGEGAGVILDALRDLGIRGSFFVTGDYIRKPELVSSLRRMVSEGHYLGPHSDTHPLYAPWEDREQTLVSEEFFRSDVQRNIDDLRALGALPSSETVYFIPPYEWYNEDQVRWAEAMGLVLFNFTPGTGSNRDWAPEDHRSFVPSDRIISDILAYEEREPHGLNGFLLLLHLGSQREDKPFLHFRALFEELQRRGYTFVRVDEMLGDASE